MTLDIDDGYTLSGETAKEDRDARPIPTIAFTYRPAQPRAVYALRFASRMARNADEEHEAGIKFVVDHVISWDVTNNGQGTKPTHENIGKLHPLFLEQMVDIIAKWAGKPNADGLTAKDESAKNSHGA